MDFFFRLFKWVVVLVKHAEVAYRAPKAGAAKKTFVRDGAKTIVDGIVAMSTGGQADTWEHLENPVDEMIEVAVDALFPSDAEKPFPHPDVS